MLEHTHFKKKNAEKILITLFLKELDAPKVVVVVHNNDFFDSYLEAVLSRGDLLLFLNGKLLRETPIDFQWLANLCVFAYYSNKERIATIDLKNYLLMNIFDAFRGIGSQDIKVIARTAITIQYSRSKMLKNHTNQGFLIYSNCYYYILYPRYLSPNLE